MDKNKILILAIIGVLGFTFWRNYGVKAKGAVILDNENKTNEQKELVNKIKETNPKEGVELKTSFGYYNLIDGNWVKTREIWEYVIKDDRGQWAHPKKVTQINSNVITMQGVNYPVLGISDTADIKLMMPNKDYIFNGNKVTEYPIASNWLIN
jgi:hypothetical protein